MGELAALGLVLSVRLAGDAWRAPWLRAAALAASVPLGLGVYLSFSRGALFACAAGLVALIVAAPHREQLEAIVLAVGAVVIASAVTAALRGVTSLSGSLGFREGQGAIALVLLVAVMSGAAAAHWQLVRRRRSTPLRLPRHAGWLALGLICAGLGVAIAAGSKEGTSRRLSASAGRYATLQSNRYDYWQVALKAFAHEPVRGVGAGGWAVWWVRYRKIEDFAQDAHSLPLQTLAELGLVGVVLLGAFVSGVALAARAAHRAAPAFAAGPMAALVVYAAHAPLDWDWQMPAVTLIAIVLAGALVNVAERREVAAYSASAMRGASRLNTHTATTQTVR
jgi:hypothetical protein